MKDIDRESKILISGGDSFIYGLDMLDCNESNQYSHSNNTWPALLAQHWGRKYLCCAYPGSANNSISRKTIMACERHKGSDLFVVVGWSFLNRFEFRFTVSPYLKPFDAIKDPEGYHLGPYGPWISFNVKDLYGDSGFIKGKNLLGSNLDPEMSKFLKSYYKYVGSDDVWEMYSTLKEVVYLQNYLKLNRIPFLFTSAHAFFHKNLNDPDIDCLIKQIDMDQWYFYPDLKGFLQWADQNDFPKRDEHPVELAHQRAFELIRNYLDNNDQKAHSQNKKSI